MVENLNSLSLLRGRYLDLNNNLRLRHPTVGEIEEYNYSNRKKEYDYDVLLNCLMSESKDIADILWFDSKIWYEDIKSEWELFIQKCIAGSKTVVLNQNIEGKVYKMQGVGISSLYNDALNFFLNTEGQYVLFQPTETVQIALALVPPNNSLPENPVFYTELYYEITRKFLKQIYWREDTEYLFTRGGTRAAKEYILKQKYKSRNKVPKYTINFESIVSSLIVKLNLGADIWDYPVYRVFDSYKRISQLDDFNYTMKALQSGMLDTKKNPINWEKIDWARVIT